MVEIAGYLFLAGAIAAFSVSGVWAVRRVGVLRLFALLMLGAGFTGAAGAFVGQDAVYVIIGLPFAVLAGMGWAAITHMAMQNLNGDTHGSR